MIYKPEPKIMKAFANLRGNPNFMTILEFIKKCRDRTDEESRTTIDEYKLRWCQGGSQDLSEILKLFEMSKQL